MFPAPVDLGIAEPDRAVSSVTHGTEAWLTGEGRRGQAWYEGGGSASDQAVQGIVDLPADRRRPDPGRPVRAGEDRDPHRHGPRPAARRLDRPDDPRHRGRAQRRRLGSGPVQLVIADARGLPRENYRKVIDGYRWLVEQGCVVVLGPMISDNSLILQATADEIGVPVHRLDRRPPLRERLLLHGRQRRHPHRGRDVRPTGCASRASRRSASFWESARRAATTPTSSGRGEPARAHRRRGGEARAEPPQGPQGGPGDDARPGRRGHLLRRLRLRDVPLRRGVRGARLGSAASWAPRSCSIRTRTSGPRASRAGTASTSSARTAPTPTTRR